MSRPTDTIQLLGGKSADAFLCAADHRGAIRFTIDNKPFFACSCREDGPVRSDELTAIDDMAIHYRLIENIGG